MRHVVAGSTAGPEGAFRDGAAGAFRDRAAGAAPTSRGDAAPTTAPQVSEAQVQRLAALVAAKGGAAVDCPVSGGCHRAATGNISIFAGAERPVFERVLPVLTTLGRRVLHTGPVGSASILKVVTNYLATANLVTLCEALTTVKGAGLELNTAFEAIRISSSTSFVHETES